MNDYEQDRLLLSIYSIFFLLALAMMYLFGNLFSAGRFFSAGGLSGTIVVAVSLIGVVYQITRIREKERRGAISRKAG